MELINERNEINNKKFEYESELSKLKEELENQIEKNNDLIKELENYKQINKKMVEENNKKQNYEKEIENLNEVVKEKEQEIEELKEDLEKSKKNVTTNSIFNKKDSGLGGYGEQEHRLSLVGEGTDQEKIERLVTKLKEYKNEIETNQELVKVLKDEYKQMKAKLENFETFGGKIQDYNEFIKLFNICLKDYKPKKKEQKEALEKLREHLKKELD